VRHVEALEVPSPILTAHAVVPGDRAIVVAPSGPVPLERFENGLKVLRRAFNFDLCLAANLLEQDGYFAGPDRLRIDALHAALGDPQSRVVWCARGGYGATRLLASLDAERLRARPQTIVGFSDITALLCWAFTKAGVIGIHGPVITQLATLHPEDVTRVIDMLRGELPDPLSATEGTVLHGGTVEGRVFPANLEVLRALVGTRYFPPLSGGILALEDVNERPYRLDRSLTHLLSCGALRGVKAVILGTFRDCDPAGGEIGPTAEQVALERLRTLGIPVVSGFRFGHDPLHNAALPFGGRARLHADDCTLEFLEPVTFRSDA